MTAPACLSGCTCSSCRIERLGARIVDHQRINDRLQHEIDELLIELAELRRENEQLKAGLLPFVKFGDHMQWIGPVISGPLCEAVFGTYSWPVCLTIGDFNRAGRLLAYTPADNQHEGGIITDLPTDTI